MRQKIDGAGFVRIFFQIMLPLVGPGLSALGILTFLGSWNNFMGPPALSALEQQLHLPVGHCHAAGIYGYRQPGPGAGRDHDFCGACADLLPPGAALYHSGNCDHTGIKG